jgi:hypothetical protein
MNTTNCREEKWSEAFVWIKARSSSHDGQCVEIAATAGKIAIRDSKDPHGPILTYAPAEFNAFIHRVRGREFDHLAHKLLASSKK